MTELALVMMACAILINTLLLPSVYPYVSKHRKHQIIFDIAYALVWEAERVWGEGMGGIKHAHVKARLYITVSTMQLLRNCALKEDYVDEIIDSAVAKMEQYRKDNPDIHISR